LKQGVKPIVGCELYVAPKGRRDRTAAALENPPPPGGAGKDLQGYKNLMQLSSRAYLEGFYYRPRVDYELLRTYSDGLIATSACLNGEVAAHLVRGNWEGALQAAALYRDIFGEGNYYLEIMENGLPEQKVANEGLIRISRQLSHPLVATNDCHYLRADDAQAHEVLLCIQTGKNWTTRIGCDSRPPISIFAPRRDEAPVRLLPRIYREHPVHRRTVQPVFEFGQFYLPQFSLDSGDPWTRN
jgi:DNA polymerase-3 subunit alpha